MQVNVELKIENEIYCTKGVVFRKTDTIGVIIPKNHFICSDKDFDCKIRGISYSNESVEFEFAISCEDYIPKTDYLLFIPFYCISVDSSKKLYSKNGYSQNKLSKLNYIMQSNLQTFSPYYNGFNLTFLINDRIINTNMFNISYVNDKMSDILFSDIKLIEGGVMRPMYSKTPYDIFGIVVHDEESKNISNSLGKIITSEGILELINLL